MPLNDAFHSVDDQQQPARPTAGLAVDPSMTLGPPVPAQAAPAAPADAWHSVPDQAPVAPKPDATPGWIMPRSKLFPEDADYLAGREKFVDEMAAQKYGAAVMSGPPDQVAKLQQWADANHPHDYSLGEAVQHPLNYLNSNTPLTPQLAWEYLKRQTPPDAIARARQEFYGGYDTHRYLELRDQMAGKLADAYVASEMGKAAAADAQKDPNPTRFPDAVHSYVNQELAAHGWMIGQGLPPVSLEKFPRATGIDPVSNPVGRTNAVGRGLNAVTWQPGYNAISLGLHAAGAVAPDTGVGRAVNDYADRMNAGQSEITGALPMSAEAQAHPFGVESLLEKGIELTPQLTGMGVVGKMGAAGHALNTAVIFGQAGNAAYDEIYQSAKRNGEADDVARQKAAGGAVAVGAVNAWLMRFGAVPKWAEADPGFRNRMVHILMSGVTQAGVAGASDATDQLANYALTGKSPEGERLLESAATMALAGGATGALSPTRKPGSAPTAAPRTPGEQPQYPVKAPEVLSSQEGPAEQLGPTPPPKNLKEAQQRRPKRQLEQTPPENVIPGRTPSPDLQVTTTDLSQAPAATPAQPAEAPKPAEPTPSPAPAATPAFDPARPLANLEDANGKMIVRGPEQIGWIQETYKRFPDPSKWEDAVRSGKLPPPPAFVEPPAPQPHPRPKPAEAQIAAAPPAEQPEAEPPLVQAAKDAQVQRKAKLEQMADDAIKAAQQPAQGDQSVIDAVTEQAAAHGEELAPSVPPKNLKEAQARKAMPPAEKEQATLAYYEDLADALRDSKEPWERSGADRLQALVEMSRKKARPDAAIVEEIVRQYARNDAHKGTDLGKAVSVLGERLLERAKAEQPAPPATPARPPQNLKEAQARKAEPKPEPVAPPPEKPALDQPSKTYKRGDKVILKDGTTGELLVQPPIGVRGENTFWRVRHADGRMIETDEATFRKPAAPAPAEPAKAPEAPRRRVEGKAADIDTANGKVKARYAAVESDSVVPSHNEFTFRPNEKHVGGQERQYDTDVNEQAKVRQNAANFDSRHVLSDDPTPASGPPMIYDDGSAIGGNNRAMIQRRVYSDPRKSGKLKADTVAAAEKFGLDPDAVAKLDKPMIVRVLADQPRDAGKLAELSRRLQKGLTQEMSTGADASSRAKILTRDTAGLDLISKLLGSEDKSVRDILGEPAKARQLAQALVKSGAVSQTELSKFTTEYGGFTDDGKKLVENMLLHTAVNKPAALDGVPHPVVQKITSNLAEFGFTGAKPDWTLAKDLTTALEGYQRWRAQAGGQPLDEWLGGKEQMSLVPDPITQPGMERPRKLLEALVNDKAAEFKARIRSYANDARSVMPGQERMFGTADASPEESFDRAFGGAPPKSSDALFLPRRAPIERGADDYVLSGSVDQAEADDFLRHFGRRGIVYEPSTPGERLIRRVADRFGIDTTFVMPTDTGEALPFSAAVEPTMPDKIYVAHGNPERAARELIGHELVHNMRRVAPDLYAKLVKALDPALVERGTDRYLDDADAKGGNMGEYAEYLRENPDTMHEEGVATLAGELATSPRVWDALSKDAPGLWGRLKELLRDVYDRLRGVPNLGASRALTNAYREFQKRTAGVPLTGDGGMLHPDRPLAAPKGFFADDVKPTAEAVRDAFKEAGDDVVSTLAPQVRNRQFGERVREHNAELARRMGIAYKTVEAARKYFAGKPLSDPKGESLAVVDRIELGRRQANPALQPFADAMRKLMNQGLADVQGMGKGALTRFIRNYFPHLWADVPKAAGLFARRPLEGTKDFLKQRKIPTIREGIELHGLEPKFENPVDMILARYREMQKFVLANKLIDDMRAQGIAKFVDARTTPPLGWAKLNDPIGTVYGRPTAKGEIRIRGYWIAEAGAANIINNHLSPGIRERSGLLRGMMTVNNVLNMAQLGLSAFHGLATTIHGSVADMATGIKHLVEGKPVEAAVSSAKSLSLLGPVWENLSLGSKVIHEWYKPGSIADPQAAILADAMVAAGARAGRDPMYQTKFREKMMEAFARGNYVGGVWRAPFAGLEAMAHPIMEAFVPRMKVGLFAKLAGYELEKLGPGASREDIRAALAPAWDHVENILGELTHDNLFWHHAAKDVAMITTRSTGWNLGTLRGGLGGIADLAGNARDLASGKPTTLSHRSAYLIALPAFAAIMGGITHRLLTGENPEELKDYFYPKTGEKDARGHDIRISLPTYVKDYVAWYRHPGQTAINKASPIMHALGEMLQNKDFYGVKIRNEDDNPAKQALSVAEYAGQQLTPFSMRDAGKISEQGLTLKSALPLAGITPAPKDLDLSPAEQKARELAVEKMPQGARTSEEVERTRAKYDLAQKVRNREPGAYGAIRQALKDRTIKPGDQKDIIDIAKKDPLTRSVEGLDLDDAMKVFDVASDAEKRKLLLPLSRKLANSRKETPEQKAAIRSKLLGERDRLRKSAA